MTRSDGLVRRTQHVLRPDPSRVVTTELIPSTDGPPPAPTRMDTLLNRVLSLSEDQTVRALDQVSTQFGKRHHDLPGILDARFDHVAQHVPARTDISRERRRLIGAYMSQEFAIEAAALFNPSMVPHPDQAGCAPGEVRFVMSVRGVGEGHISCVEFRTGTVGRDGEIRMDTPSPRTARPRRATPKHSRHLLERLNDEMPGPAGGAGAVLASLPETFSTTDLETAVGRWAPHASVDDASVTGARLAFMAQLAYTVEFDEEAPLDARVIMPGSPLESRGLEDVRLTRVTGPDGGARYLGTYTAYDGVNIAPHLLRTDDFTTFELSPLTGAAAKNKGLALFPRLVDGQYLAMSRWDRENNSLATSDDLLDWADAGTLRDHRQPWEIVQSGNCGSPLETAAGWLVLTHGVGPMRRYAIGAILLDLDDPRRVIGSLVDPLLTPGDDERDGYVPNVVYSCGAMLCGDTMVLPYGASDQTVRIALVDVPALLDAMQPL